MIERAGGPLGLAFTGVSSSTLTLFADLSRIAIWVVLSGIAAGVVWFGWLVGDGPGDTPGGIRSGNARRLFKL